MAQTVAFGGMDYGSIAGVSFREGSLLTRNAGIVTIGSIMAAGSEDLDADIKMNLLHTKITKGVPIYEDEFDEGKKANFDFVEKCAEFYRYLDGLGPVGFARSGIGYVSRSSSALSTAKDGRGNAVDMFLYGIPPECVEDVKVYKNGAACGKKLDGEGVPVEIELETESVLTKKNGIVRLSEILYHIIYDDGCRNVTEEEKRKVVEIVMSHRKGGYPKEAMDILGRDRMDRIRYLWAVCGAFDPLCYAGKVVGFGDDGEGSGYGNAVLLSNMFLNGKETQPGSIYTVSAECIKSIRLLE